MFTANSRYVKCPIVEIETAAGKTVSAVTLRRLPYVPGHLTEVSGTDRLDLMAYRKYREGTEFWHVADANTALEANTLVESERPENPLLQQQSRHLLLPES